ncbi:MAG: ABC transporter permease [Sporomusa sp.]
MRSTKAVFTKQAKDMFKNPSVLIMFVLFPAVAFIMTTFVTIPENEYVSSNMFVTMMASIFAGMGLIVAVSGAIAEDIERKSLRFLIIAGVKPHQYLVGVGGFFLLAATVTSMIFAFIGRFTGVELAKFLIIMVSGTAASILLGATIGMWSKNAQAAGGLAMPFAVIVGFTPMIAGFNETVEKFAGVLYTQQINVIVNDFEASIVKPLAVIATNIAVLTVFFVIAYKKKGLKA